MELKEYLNIVKKYKGLFIGTVIAVVLGSLAYFSLRPVSYNVSLALNISRSGGQATSDYKYDDFYRIQADEKFAETVAEWLKTPRVAEDIYQEAGINTQNFSLRKLTKIIKAEKMSSQVVLVSFGAPSGKDGQKIAASVCKIISQNTQNLNRDQKEEAWFEVLSASPVIRENYFDPKIVIIVSILAGIFLAFWITLGKHYLE